ncbi:MAG: hypothetical protein K2X27_15430 [Candidatus Obscuribacterales bacterium]|nr:hypothetical protein [Candidatus Obscuribacterales bacterium]
MDWQINETPTKSEKSSDLSDPLSRLRMQAGLYSMPELNPDRNAMLNRASSQGSQDSFLKLQASRLLLRNNEISPPEAILNGFAEGMIQRPILAIKQSFGAETEVAQELRREKSKSHQTGQVIGSLVPYVGLVALTRGAAGCILGESSASLCRMIGEQATAGFLVGSLLTPSNLKPGEDLISARLNQGKEAATKLATLSGTSSSLERSLPDFGDNGFSEVARRITISFLSGTVGGFIDARGRTSFGASSEDSLSTVLGHATFTSIIGSNDKLFKATTNNSIPEMISGSETRSADKPTLLKGSLFLPVVQLDDSGN